MLNGGLTNMKALFPTPEIILMKAKIKVILIMIPTLQVLLVLTPVLAQEEVVHLQADLLQADLLQAVLLTMPEVEIAAATAEAAVLLTVQEEAAAAHLTKILMMILTLPDQIQVQAMAAILL